MLRWRIRSALYIDFENVPLPPDAIANWLAWLEDGAFEASGHRRHFLQKRVYWNSHAERNRELFQRHGFSAVLVGKFAGLKNGADIRMAMDVVETTYTRAEIDEFILLTGDSDFVPVLERLKHKAKRSAIVVTEHRPNIHTTYQLNADILIPSRRLAEAAQYRRSRRTLLGRLLGRRPLEGKAAAAVPAPKPAVAALLDTPRTQPRTQPPRIARPATDETTARALAAQRVARLLLQQPRNYVAQKRVLTELERVPGFKRQGSSAYLGTGSYKTLMRELAHLDPRISVVDQPGGGTGVVFMPLLESAPSEPRLTTARPATAAKASTTAGDPDTGTVADVVVAAPPCDKATPADPGAGLEPIRSIPPPLPSIVAELADGIDIAVPVRTEQQVQPSELPAQAEPAPLGPAPPIQRPTATNARHPATEPQDA